MSKRVSENFDNDKYVCEGENPYGRVKTHFSYVIYTSADRW